MRVVDGLGTLRQRDAYLAIRDATFTAFTREVFRLVHFSIQSNHIHLIAEAANKKALSRGMQGFQISAAKRINAAITARTGARRRGQVFADRYHARALSTPRAVRHALCYVMNNWRRHREDESPRTRAWKVDPFSNGFEFFGWKERAHLPTIYQPSKAYLEMALVTWLPKTWLLREGWKRHGLISIREVPGPQP
jgi:REP element-mobilizing transposase RayT